MKRLFQVIRNNGRAHAMVPTAFVEIQYFDNKALAKRRRDALNTAPDGHKDWHIGYGPDHHLFNKGFTPGRFKGKNKGSRAVSGIAKNKRHVHPERAARMANRNRKAAAA